MRYLVAIHKEDDSCFGISVPDIEGCFSAGDTLDEALVNTKEAISEHLEVLAKDGIICTPKASAKNNHMGDPPYVGATWASVVIK